MANMMQQYDATIPGWIDVVSVTQEVVSAGVIGGVAVRTVDPLATFEDLVPLGAEILIDADGFTFERVLSVVRTKNPLSRLTL